MRRFHKYLPKFRKFAEGARICNIPMQSDQVSMTEIRQLRRIDDVALRRSRLTKVE